MDKDGSNSVEYNEFLGALVQEPSPARADEVRRVFELIDEDGDGTINLADIGLCFVPAAHPHVVAGTAQANDVLHDFLASLDEGDIVNKTTGKIDEPSLQT